MDYISVFRISAMIMMILVMDNPMQLVSGRWTASTIIEVATELLEPSDDQLGSPSRSGTNDPLLDSIEDHQSRRHGTKTTPRTKNVPLEGGDGRFLVPMLSNSVGDNNQLMEYMAAAVVARATGRTLCLEPFFNGPIKHTRQLPTGGLTMEERYDMDVLSKFVKVASFQRCLQECSRQIDGFWWLRHSSSSMLSRDWRWNPQKAKTHELGWSFVNWTSIDDIKQTLQEFNKDSRERCVGLGGLFPGLRWRGAYLAASLYMRPSKPILQAATALQDLAIGRDRSFLAVHWRFEESLCKGEQLGLCFLRCGDGAVIDSGLHAGARGLPSASIGPEPKGRKTPCKRIVDSKAVLVSKKDLVAAISDKASKENVSSVYLATDGWLRGPQAQSLVIQVVGDLRKKGLSVTGLWKIKELPNLITTTAGGKLMYVDELIKRTLKGKLSGHAISEVEQEMCQRAGAFMGSGESTWSLAVFRARLAARRGRQESSRRSMRRGGDESNGTLTDAFIISDDAKITEELLQDSHAAGLQCRYRSLYRKAKVRGVVPEETYQDEAPDSWLDMEACEAQLSMGGSCKLLDCFP